MSVGVGQEVVDNACNGVGLFKDYPMGSAAHFDSLGIGDRVQ